MSSIEEKVDKYMNEQKDFKEKTTEKGEKYLIKKLNSEKFELKIPENEKSYVLLHNNKKGRKKWIGLLYSNNEKKPKDTFGYFVNKTDIIEYTVQELHRDARR